jgi:ribosomal protein S12 methylthiotransferase
VPEEVKEERRSRLMALQEEISRRRLARRVGQEMAVLIDHVSTDGAVGRTYADAPEIDGRVFVEDGEELSPGDIVWVEITDSDAHDLYGELAEE